jgi:hypothetical protein
MEHGRQAADVIGEARPDLAVRKSDPAEDVAVKPGHVDSAADALMDENHRQADIPLLIVFHGKLHSL